MEENELIKKIRQGDEDAFEFMFRKFFPGLCLYAEHFLKDADTSEDIVEDYFCELWDHCHDLTISSSLKGYLYRSIHNRCLKYIRHRNIEKKYVAQHQYYFFDEEILDGQPLSNLITQELEDRILSLVQSLPGQCRIIFCLNRYENKTYTEIADTMGISVNTVKTQMSRALLKLREGMKEFLEN